MEVNFNLSNKRAIAGVIILAALIGLAFYLPNIFTYFEPQVCTVDGVCQHEQYAKFMTELIPVFVVVGIVIGALVFFFMSSRLENKQKDISNLSAVLVQFLGKDERLVVQKLLDNDGKVLQAELSRTEGLGKLKSHRIIQRLVDRQVVEVEKFGKTNIVKLSKGIKDALVAKK
ncbi:MAG: hypothetical protein WCI04_00700 [archaeon]